MPRDRDRSYGLGASAGVRESHRAGPSSGEEYLHGNLSQEEGCSSLADRPPGSSSQHLHETELPVVPWRHRQRAHAQHAHGATKLRPMPRELGPARPSTRDRASAQDATLMLSRRELLGLLVGRPRKAQAPPRRPPRLRPSRRRLAPARCFLSIGLPGRSPRPTSCRAARAAETASRPALTRPSWPPRPDCARRRGHR